jgi:RNA polymerase sigma-70 factor (ECF subfamily)
MDYIPAASSLSEKEVITLLHRGNEKALAAIFNQYHAGMIYFAGHFMGDIQAAEDIVAESFFKLWEKRKKFQNLESIRAFLLHCVKNASFNYIKQFRCHSTHHGKIKYLAGKPEELSIEAKMIKAELLNRIRLDIEQLPPMRKRIFTMIYVEGLNTFEVARILQISADTVRVQKARALHTLREIARQRSVTG